MKNLTKFLILQVLLSNSAFSQACKTQSPSDLNQKLLNQIVKLPYSNLKKCFADLAKSTDVATTSVPGIDDSAVALLCSGPSFKISTAFTKEQLEAGVPILADTRNIYVYLTDSGFSYAEFPVFYYIVKYYDASGGYDIGMLPKNFMPIQSSDGKFRVVDSNGVILTIDNPKTKPIDFRVNYSDKYSKLFAAYSLEPVSIKPTSTAMSNEKAYDCMLKQAKVLLNRMSTRKMDFIYAYQFEGDTNNAINYRNSDPVKLLALKEKYKRTRQEMVEEYVKTLKTTAPACSNIFTQEDYDAQVERTLSNFLPRYEGEKHYIDSIQKN